MTGKVTYERWTYVDPKTQDFRRARDSGKSVELFCNAEEAEAARKHQFPEDYLGNVIKVNVKIEAV